MELTAGWQQATGSDFGVVVVAAVVVGAAAVVEEAVSAVGWQSPSGCPVQSRTRTEKTALSLPPIRRNWDQCLPQ